MKISKYLNQVACGGYRMQKVFEKIKIYTKVIFKKIAYILPPEPIPNFFAEKEVNIRRIRFFRRENFPDSGPLPWLDRENALSEIDRALESKDINFQTAEICKKWHRDGYVVLENFVSAGDLDLAWEAYESAIHRGVLKPPVAVNSSFPDRTLNPHLLIPEMKNILKQKKIMNLLSVLMGREATAFQTIAAHAGSQQLEHSDAIHMTTYPMGYMAAAWIAFEDIHLDSGPLVYYPGSHRLPYYLSLEVDISPQDFIKRGYRIYEEKYEPFIQNLIKEKNLKPQYFSPKKGDVLLWHHNLLHGGSPRKNPSLSRKSVVCHYFVEGAICYHDLASSLAEHRR